MYVDHFICVDGSASDDKREILMTDSCNNGTVQNSKRQLEPDELMFAGKEELKLMDKEKELQDKN